MTVTRKIQIHKGGDAVAILASGDIGWLIVDIEDTPARQETLTVFLSIADMRRIARRLLDVAAHMETCDVGLDLT